LGIDTKLNNYLQITGIMFQTQKTLKTKRIKLYNKPYLPAALYGSENWSIKSRDARRITAAEVK